MFLWYVCIVCRVVKFRHSGGARNVRPKADHSDPEFQYFSGMYLHCAVLSSSAIAEELGMSGPKQIILIWYFNVSLVCLFTGLHLYYTFMKAGS